MQNLTNIMKKPWILPACFLLVAALVNFVARFVGNADVAAMVKPSLLPLVALTTVSAIGSLEDKAIRRLLTAQLLGAAGDIFLIASGTVPFALGLGCFLAGHIFYFTVFGSISWKGIKPVQWIGILAVMALAVAGLLMGIGVEGTFLVPFALYGLALMFLIFCGLAGVLRNIGNKSTWAIITCGGVLFAFSDSLIAIQTFNGESTFLEFLVMVTYVVAQCLLAWGAVRLYRPARQ